jgi:hypothetical protein
LLAYPRGEEGGRFLVNDFYLPSLRVEGGGGRVSTLWTLPVKPTRKDKAGEIEPSSLC